MKTHPAQRNFVQGELSPLMGGRSDLDMYQAGLVALVNMYTDARGPTKTREGMKYMTQFVGSRCRIETIYRTDDSFYILVFLNLEVKIIQNLDNPTVQTLVSPWTEYQLEDLQLVPYPVDKTTYVLHPNVQTQKIVDGGPSAPDEIFLADGDVVVPGGVTEATVCVCGGGGGGSGSVESPPVFGAGGGGSGVVKINIITVPAETIDVVVGARGLGGISSFWGPLVPGNDGEDSVLTYLAGSVISTGGKGGNGATGGDGSDGGGDGGNAYPSAQNGEECSAVCSGSPNAGGTTAGFNGGGGGGGFGEGGSGASGSAAVNTGGGGAGSQSSSSNGGNGGSGKVVIFWGAVAGELTLTPVTFVNKPASWTGSNWPAAGVKYQGRLWLGGAPSTPEEFWGSKSDTPEDFNTGTAQSDEAIQHSIDEVGLIRWMKVTKSLIVGTVNDEFTVVADSGLLKPGDIEVKLQSSYGSMAISPIVLGDQIMYVNADKRKIRSINYEWRQDNWQSMDLTFPSEHITEGLIKQMAWCQNPNNLLWGLLRNGTLCCMTYERGTGVFGWHRHETNGNVLSIASGSDGQRNVLILAVLRQGEIYIEYLTFDYILDSYKKTTTIVSSGGLFYVEGFDHLESLTVQIISDGSVHPSRIVGAESSSGAGDGATGRVYLKADADSVIIGLGYTQEMEPLPLDDGAPTGSGLSHKKRRNNVFIKVLNSGPPLINGERYKDVDATSPMDSPPALISKDLKVPSLGWDRDAGVNIKQDLPMPLTVLAVYGEEAKNAF